MVTAPLWFFKCFRFCSQLYFEKSGNVDIHSVRTPPPPMSIFIHYLETPPPPIRVDVLCTQSLDWNDTHLESREDLLCFQLECCVQYGWHCSEGHSDQSRPSHPWGCLLIPQCRHSWVADLITHRYAQLLTLFYKSCSTLCHRKKWVLKKVYQLFKGTSM